MGQMLEKDTKKAITGLKSENDALRTEVEHLKNQLKMKDFQLQHLELENQKRIKDKAEYKEIIQRLERCLSEQNEFIDSQRNMFTQTSEYMSKVIKELEEGRDEITMQKEFLEVTIIELEKSKEETNIQKKLLEKTHKELDEAYSDITASIAYAQRIQEAMLPNVQNLKEWLSDAFVLFQPRDVVSGDFYWFTKTDNKIIIAAVDCTGHGVPGAFMSLIGNDMLHEIVEVFKITEADQILNLLHKGIRKTLKQYETNNRDGMDIALCVIDIENQVLQYAGAHNPLYFMQNGEDTLLKANKFAVGGYQREGERIFTKHEICIQTPTTFYIFSDGYQDQFGGPHNRKFMAKRLRKILYEIHQKPMHKQQNILKRVLNYWKRGHRQLDDILVIGVKV